MDKVLLVLIVILIVLLWVYFTRPEEKYLLDSDSSTSSESRSSLESERNSRSSGEYSNPFSDSKKIDEDNKSSRAVSVKDEEENSSDSEEEEREWSLSAFDKGEKQRTENSQDWYTSDQDTEEYIARKYPTEKEQDSLKFIWKIKWLTFSDREKIWDHFIYRYGFLQLRTSYTFFLINVDDLTELVYLLNEDNWKTPEMMKKFNLIPRETIGRKKCEVDEEKKLLAKQRSFVENSEKEFGDKVFIIIDNLANQILARCIIIANRLTHGVDKESEENIMRLAFMFRRCNEIPNLKIFSEEQAENKLQLLIEKAINGDQSLLSRLQDLPYLNPKYKFKE